MDSQINFWTFFVRSFFRQKGVLQSSLCFKFYLWWKGWSRQQRRLRWGKVEIVGITVVGAVVSGGSAAFHKDTVIWHCGWPTPDGSLAFHQRLWVYAPYSRTAARIGPNPPGWATAVLFQLALREKPLFTVVAVKSCENDQGRPNDQDDSNLEP